MADGRGMRKEERTRSVFQGQMVSSAQEVGRGIKGGITRPRPQAPRRSPVSQRNLSMIRPKCQNEAMLCFLIGNGDVCSVRLAGDSKSYYPGPYLEEREQESPSYDAKDSACSNMSDPSDYRITSGDARCPSQSAYKTSSQLPAVWQTMMWKFSG
jgi:hypothetical protein